MTSAGKRMETKGVGYLRRWSQEARCLNVGKLNNSRKQKRTIVKQLAIDNSTSQREGEGEEEEERDEGRRVAAVPVLLLKID